MYQLVIKNSYHRKKPGVTKKVLNYIITFLLCVVIITVFAYKTLGNNKVEFKKITVKSGQTLWSIANKYNSYNEDPRKMVYKIKQINNLDKSIIQPGQQILIPVN
ncbi:cell division suppressor protein YneA [Halothermothrix orenii]|nr:LysM peptidoglycan-binding domain-containing protein [Halothermothrix orenii]